ncbi:hypothetical protein EVAR_101889_1 [Eumeta japonica]|uniref:Uncharacterized protein n=1 Tax=Eumeta variegata TaxID=151549 RepID=A0A4C1SNL9_EUMVA|nr:hypothetical protein EVAR_101889_1 [Eumeta japonica]
MAAIQQNGHSDLNKIQKGKPTANLEIVIEKNDVIKIEEDASENVDQEEKPCSSKNLSNGENNGLSNLLAPGVGPMLSCMEQESARERLRAALLKQCGAILKQGDQRYTKENLHKTFQDEDPDRSQKRKRIGNQNWYENRDHSRTGSVCQTKTSLAA